MVNRVELIGNLTADPELRYTPSGTPYCYVRMATNRITRTERQTDFHFVIAWHALAERTAEFLRLGDRAFVEGRIENNSYADKDGRRIERYRIVAGRILALERRKERGIRTGTESDPSGDATHIANLIAGGQASEPEHRDPVEDGA
jgi:single-strand DNA-binding protein